MLSLKDQVIEAGICWIRSQRRVQEAHTVGVVREQVSEAQAYRELMALLAQCEASPAPICRRRQSRPLSALARLRRAA